MFNRARLKLTAWYLLILMIVMIFFSLTIRNMLMRQVTTFVVDQRLRIEKKFGPMQPVGNSDQEFIKDADHRIIGTLVFINGIILVIAGGLSFVLAGKTLKPIKQMVEDQNRFVTDSSHELRTPLASLKIAMEVALRDKNLTIKEARDLITENIEEVNSLQQLSNKLLSLASRQDNDKKLTAEKFLVEEVIAESVKSVSTLAKNKGIKIENNIKTKVEIHGNRLDIKELFNIILENAVKYSKEKSVISIDLKANNKVVTVSVKDQGIGVSYRDIPRIFDRFFRGDVARSSGSSSGFGLGLSIAKKIVTDHHGSISVKSKIGRGSTFNVELPR